MTYITVDAPTEFAVDTDSTALERELWRLQDLGLGAEMQGSFILTNTGHLVSQDGACAHCGAIVVGKEPCDPDGTIREQM